MSFAGDGFDRRSFLVLVLQALLLSLFPWLRKPEALPLVEKVAEEVVDRALFKSGSMRITFAVRGFELSETQWELLRTERVETYDSDRTDEGDEGWVTVLDTKAPLR